MKILQVRFKNLNSLVGHWQIDLTHPAFAADGIFAITGPTGAGKTTILDAICLALYGRTPRLNKVTKSGNEIMSRHTGECFAEVTFKTQTGYYRCHWSQHKARKKPDGELQAPKHEIADADSGEIFESKIRGVADQIEATTGMDFDRFTRSMLLAQGDFAAFLQAAPDERAPILEQITGTEIYSQISIRVHERLRAEQEKLNILQAETAGVVILEPEQEKEIGQALESKQKEETELCAKYADTEKAIAWLATINDLTREILTLADEANTLQSAVKTFQPAREILDRALRAASLDGTYATLTATRKQLAEDQEALKALGTTLPGLEVAFSSEAELLQSAEKQTKRAKEALKDAAPTILKIRALDQTLDEQQKTILDGAADCQKDGAAINAEVLARNKKQRERIEAQKTLERVDDYLLEHARDEWLVGGLAGVEEQLAGLLVKHKEIVRKEGDQGRALSDLQQATTSVDTCRKQTTICRQELDGAGKRLEQDKDALRQLLAGRLLREYRAEKETLLREMVFLAKIAELETHRTKLQDGTPCPLCGATEHPFAQGNVPVPDATEEKIAALTKLISQAEDQEVALKNLETAQAAAGKHVAVAEKKEATATHSKEAAEQAFATATEELAQFRTDCREHRQAVTLRLLPLGITEILETQVGSLLASLQERLSGWQRQIKNKGDIEKQNADIDSELKRLDAVIETRNTALADKRTRLESVKKEHAAGKNKRKTLYDDKNPNAEEGRLNVAVTAAESAEKQARERHTALQQQWHAAQAQAASLKERIDQREPEQRKLAAEFSAALATAEFSDEAQFVQARLPPEQKAELAAQDRKLGERQTDLQVRQKDREERLATEMAKKITDESLEKLEPQSKEYEESLKVLRDLVAGLKHKLSENAAAKKRIKDKQQTSEAQKNECHRWKNLHDLIGSADGKKFRNFAQGLTFELMIGHANHQLRKMTDRYLLVRDKLQPLELNVIDSYQAGVTRSTKNLSGGESFLVSLSLALGLSHMASRNVRVDSLFLDEGFGTLDDEALDTALETLAGLRQDGKLIGVISHVAALKERIATGIQVEQQTGGRSLLSGPGCTQL